MATRSTIAIMYPTTDSNYPNEKTIKSIYCYYDGYFEHNGKILSEYYNSQVRAEELIKLGDISSLGICLSVEEKEQICQDKSLNPNDFSVTVAYERDRDETNTSAIIIKTYQKLFLESGKLNTNILKRIANPHCEYLYIFDVEKSEWLQFEI